MAGGSTVLYTSARKGFIDGTLDWDADSHYAVLLTSSYVPSLGDSTLADITANEASGYTRKDLTGETVTTTPGGDAVADADNVTFASGTYTVHWIVIVKGTVGTASGTDPLICYGLLSDAGSLTMTVEALTVTWGVEGVFKTGGNTPGPTTYSDLSAVYTAISGGSLSNGDLWRLAGTDAVLGAYEVVGVVDGGYPSWAQLLPASALGVSWALSKSSANHSIGTDANGHPYLDCDTSGGALEDVMFSSEMAQKSTAVFTLYLTVDTDSAAGSGFTFGTTLQATNGDFSNGLAIFRGCDYNGSSTWRTYNADLDGPSFGTTTNLQSTASTTYQGGQALVVHGQMDRFDSATPTMDTYVEEAGGDTYGATYTLGTTANGWNNDTGPEVYPGVYLNDTNTGRVTLNGIIMTRAVPDIL